MKTNSTKTTAQLKALQTQAQALSQTLSKEVVIVTKGEQHIKVMPGRAYELSIEGGKDFDLIAKKVGDDLEVLLPNDTTIVFDGYFEVCTSDSSYLVSLPSEGGIYHVVEGNSITLADGSQIIHFYGDESALSAIATHQSALFAESFNDVYLLTGMFSSLSIGSGEVLGGLAAVGLAGAGGGGISSLEGVLQMVASAGKFIEDNGGFIELYKYINGELVLFKSASLDSSGEYDFSIGDYKGIIVAKLIDKNGDEADFRDEATGAKTDITATLLAVIDTSQGGNIAANITPLTTIAALVMGLTVSGELPTGATLETSAINDANKGVAKAFGLGDDTDVVTTKVQTVTTQDGETSTSNAYGNALAALSGVDSSKNSGNMAATIAQFKEELTGTGADLKLTEDGQQDLLDGASKAETSNSKIASGLTDIIKSTDAIDSTTETTITLGFEDTGTSATDDIVQAVDADGNPTAGTAATGNIRINVVGVESDWVYSINAGVNWSLGTGTGFNLAEKATAYNKADIMVRNGTGYLFVPGNPNAIALDTAGTISVDGETPDGATSTALSSSNSSSASVIDVAGMDDDSTWQYSTENGANGTWKVGVGSSFSLAANTVYATNQIHVKEIDAAGNESTILKNTAEITGSSLALSLNSDTGSDILDGKTNDATINVIIGSNVTWEYTINGSTSWNPGGTGNGSFELLTPEQETGDILLSKIKVKVVGQDVLSAVTLSHHLVSSIDVSTATADATLTLASAGDNITSNKVINVTGGGTWEYSTDGGENWRAGSGSSFELSSQSYAQDQVQVKQVDVHGNYSEPTLFNAITIDYIAPTVTSFTSSTVGGSYGVGSKINITATVSEEIKAGGQITVTLETGSTDRIVVLTAGVDGILTGIYTVKSGDTSGDLTVVSFTIGAGAQAPTDAAGNAITADTVPSSRNIADSKAIVIDTTAPTATLSSNIAPTSDLTMTFSETVTAVSGKKITLYKSDGTQIEQFDAADTSKVTFSGNTVSINPASNLDANANYYVQIDAGAFKDTVGNDYAGISNTSSWSFTAAALTTDAVWANSSTDVASNGINANELSSLSITGTLSNLNDVASGVTISSIVFKAASGSANNVSYTGTMPTLSGDSNGATWTLSNANMPTLVSGESYTIEIGLATSGSVTGTGGSSVLLTVDTTAPTVSSTTISATDSSNTAKTSTLVAGDKVVVTVAMSEATTVTGTPTYTIDVGGVNKTASYVSGSGTSSLKFSYTIATGDTDTAGGITSGTGALVLAGGTLKDGAGNAAALTTAVAASNTLAVDTVAPTVSSTTISATDSSNTAKTSTLVAGDKVVVTVAMSEATTVTGTPTYTIDVGGVNKTASYVTGSGTSSLKFSYTIATGDTDTAGGITSGTGALVLAGGTLKDGAGSAAALTTAVAASNTLAVDTVAPTVSSTTISATDSSNTAKTSTLVAGDKVVVTVVDE
ncbi:beta strand repeat-containing protein [Isorropodon fossajaponicum symbiont]|uniref:beta strand repeat-containing protein n=1 Tax=Isorropodon fossajaponicum symbiont TaxID=883811 RepID=UPI001915C2B6|nr:Ig-like domain-containing protein [Isorropodon fossajaponicum symbiont]